jgi:hypothetical protein
MLSADQELVMLSRIVKPADARSFLAIAIVVPSLMLFTIFFVILVVQWSGG